MSLSRKKITIDDIPLVTVTEKLKQKHNKSYIHRQCCDKENSKERNQSKNKEGNSSQKKLKKKKFLQEEVEKMLQKRYFNEETKLNEIKLNNACEFLGLKGDLQEMKEVISKLSQLERQPESTSASKE